MRIMVRKTLLILLLALVFVPFSAVQGQQATFGSLHATLVGDDLTAATLPSGVGIGLDYSPVIGQTQLLIEEAIPGEYVVSFPDLSTHNELAALCSYAVGSPECELNNQSLFTRPGIDCYIGTCSYVLNVERGRVTKIAIIYLDAASPPERLNVAKQGTGTGTVTGGPISCGSVCTATVPSGTTVNLSASSSPDSIFTGWFGPCTGTGICTIRVGATRTVVASFDLKPVPPKPSVLFIPGFMGSRLYQETNQLWEPNLNPDVVKLFLDVNGSSTENGIYTEDIIGAVFGFNVYKTFEIFMNNLKNEKGLIADWKPFPYDWRLSLDEIINKGVTSTSSQRKYLENEIAQLATGGSKVTIIAHSNGGLVAKAFIKQQEELKNAGKPNVLDKIDMVILVAVPQMGTPKTIGALLHGDEQEILEGFIVRQHVMKTFGENMPGAYNLLPSKKYFDQASSSLVYFDPPTDLVYNFQVYNRIINTYDSMVDFLLGSEGRIKPEARDGDIPNILNPKLIDNAGMDHSSLDEYILPNFIRVSEIAGWGLPTILGLKYYTTNECLFNIPLCRPLIHEPVMTRFGDGTVVGKSALIIPNATKYYLDLNSYNRGLFLNLRRNRSHASIFEVDSVQTLIENVLKLNPELPAFISTTSPLIVYDDIVTIANSPVVLDAFDLGGYHTGLSTTSDMFSAYDEEIQGSHYMEFGHSKWLSLPSSSNINPVFIGTDFGTLQIKVQNIKNDNVVSETTFPNIPISPSVSGKIVTTGVKKIIVDTNNDGTADFEVGAGVTLDPLMGVRILQKIVKSMKLYSSVQDAILEKLDDIEDEIKDKDYDDAREKRNELREDLLDADWKEEKITQDQRNNVLSLINTFIIEADDNLGLILLTEDIIQKVKEMSLTDDVKDSILDKLDDVYEEFLDEDNDDAIEKAKKILKNLKDPEWKKGEISLVERSVLIKLIGEIIK